MGTATALALPVVPGGTSTDPPGIPEAVREIARAHEAELQDADRRARQAKRRERRWRRLAYRRLRSIGLLQRAMRTQVRLGGASGLERGFLCIHGHEGDWSDGGAPYWGGLQMDRSFMATYGGPFYRAFGTADRWTPAMQIATAERAVLSGKSLSSGWPNTSRMCGL